MKMTFPRVNPSVAIFVSLSGAGVPGLDVSDPGFDIDAALDASAVADPSIAGTAGK